MMKFELLPNEIFLECVQYLNAPDIFDSFDQLNYRFSRLIRNIPLHLDFDQFKKPLFNQFCQTIVLNPEIKQRIIYLQLSNEGTCDQIESFLSLLPLNDFIHLRSLSLVNLKENNIEQLVAMLPFLSNLYCFSFTELGELISEIISALSKSKLRILSVSNLDFNLTGIYQTIPVTSLTILNGYSYYLLQLFKYTPMLKYLRIGDLNNYIFRDYESNIINENAVYLKELIIDDCQAKFKYLELLLKHTPNLQIFSICSSENSDMYDAIRWQCLIESLLQHLSIFEFEFNCSDLKKSKEFQTDFWHKQHHWYTNYETYYGSSTIYTMPYIGNIYEFTPDTHRYGNSFMDKSNGFDNVNNLILMAKSIIDDSPYYFRNVESLVFTDSFAYDNETDEDQLKTTQIKFLNTFVNLSNIKCLTINDKCFITSSVFLDLLIELPNVSSLAINERILIEYFKNIELCKYLNKRINKLDISSDRSDRSPLHIKINLLFCQIFSNLEQFKCHYIESVDDLLLILTQCLKLSVIKITRISTSIHSWIQVNAATLNVYLDFESTDDEYDYEM